MGTVNIFLGGTGKGVAVDIQDSRVFDEVAMSEPIAFDLNARIRDGVQLNLVTPAGDTASDVDALAKNWSTRSPGRGVGPEAKARVPGPERSPENSVLAKIAEGIRRDSKPSEGLFALRAHGLAIFSLLFGQGTAGTGAGRELRAHIERLVDENGTEDDPASINLITSTAGGTGAGTVIPLALWLRQKWPDLLLDLIAVTPSAFVRDLRGSSDTEELAAKGHSGTYSILRELSFLSEATDPQTVFSPRGLPVTPRPGLVYRPGERLFRNVFWFGGRGGPQEDAFEEAGVLVRLLSHVDTKQDLHAETTASAMRWVGAVTAIEYPKLRYKRRMISSVLQEAYSALRTAPERFQGTSGDSTTLLAYVDENTDRVLGKWFHTHRQSVLALGGLAKGVNEVAADDLDERVRSAAGVALPMEERVPRGNKRPGHERNFPYLYEDDDWKRYTGEISDALDGQAGRIQEALQQTIRQERREEERAFGNWLAKKVLEERLSADRPVPTQDLDRVLKQLDENAEELDKHFAGNIFSGVATLDDCESEIESSNNRFDKPPIAATSLSWGLRVALFFLVPAAFLLVWAFLAASINGIVLTDIGAILGTLSDLATISTVVVPFLIYSGVAAALVSMSKRPTGTKAARKRADARELAEGVLYEAYGQRNRIRALRWVHQELRGGNARISFFRELRQQIEAARNAVGSLDNAYAALQDKAAADLAQAASRRPHVAAEVGESIVADRTVAESVVAALHERLKVDVRSGPEPRVRDLTLRLEHSNDNDKTTFDAAAAAVSEILMAVEGREQVGLRDAERIESRWRGSAWNLVYRRLGENFPETFVDALEYGEDDPARALAKKLDGVGLPRPPSANLNTRDDQPARRRYYVGSDAIKSVLSDALGEKGASELSPTRQKVISEEYKGPTVVPTIGNQIVFLDLWTDSEDPRPQWAPSVIASAEDAKKAMETYYGTREGVPEVATAVGTCFTVLPELLAATKIELSELPVRPLSLAVVARLLGSDLDTQGPTYAELFYLLRARKWLTTHDEGDDQEAAVVISIAEGVEGARSTLELAKAPLGNLDDGEMFGAGREAVVAFDAFCDFMRYTGARRVDAAEVPYSYGEAVVSVDKWANEPERVAALQRAVVGQWYKSELGFDVDCAGMIAALEEDLTRMNDTPEKESWERAMRRLLNGPERRRVRANIVRMPQRRDA